MTPAVLLARVALGGAAVARRARLRPPRPPLLRRRPVRPVVSSRP